MLTAAPTTSDSQTLKNSIDCGEKGIAGILRNLHQQIKVAERICKDWKHHLLQYTCLDSWDGEQTLQLGRLLRAASASREKLILQRNHLVLLDATIHIIRPAD